MKNSQKGFTLLVSLIILGLVVAGSVYIYKNKKVEVPAVVDTGTQQSNQIQQTDTSDSKIYSEKYQDVANDFNFNIPSNWKIVQLPKPSILENQKWNSYTIESPDFNEVTYDDEDGMPHSDLKQGAKITVLVVQAPPSFKTIKNLQEFHKNWSGDSGPILGNEQLIKIEGKDALLYNHTDKNGRSDYALELLDNGNWIKIYLRYKGVDGKEVFNTILSTFKFTK